MGCIWNELNVANSRVRLLYTAALSNSEAIENNMNQHVFRKSLTVYPGAVS